MNSGRRREFVGVRLIGIAGATATSVAFAGCGGDDSFAQETTAGACAPVLAHFQECNLATTGRFQHDGPARTTVEQCLFNCYSGAACTDLEQYLCGGNLVGQLLTCYTGCTTFLCGDGNRVDLVYRCDGAANCADGSDEASCQTITCIDGTVLPLARKCDYRSDCPDNRDEEGCPAFQCASGQKVSPASRCDGNGDCLDRTDETGCPSFICANGDRVLESARCNGPSNCTDGSDEQNCPPVASITCSGQTVPLSTFFDSTECY